MSFRLAGTGEVVISAETAGIQAKDAGHVIEREIFYLAIHGLLHLSGFRDESEVNRKSMLKRQDVILEMIWPIKKATASEKI